MEQVYCLGSQEFGVVAMTYHVRRNPEVQDFKSKIPSYGTELRVSWDRVKLILCLMVLGM